MDRGAKALPNTVSSINKLKKREQNLLDPFIVAANNRIYAVYKILYVAIVGYLIIIIGLTVSNSG